MNPVALHAFNPGPMTGTGNWTWLLRGRVPTLIDAGTGSARHLDALERELGGRPLAQLLVTHGHSDHASGAPAIHAKMPGARFLKMPWPQRDAKYDVPWEPLAGGSILAAGDTELMAVHTPGHAPDHLCLWERETRSLFCGDLLISGGTVWIPGDDSGDVGAYIASLERVLALDPVRVFPAHGPVIDDPSKLIRHYIRHRQEREAQVIDALGQGDSTVEAMTARIYRDIRPELVPPARQSVTAHLRKLAREGRVRSDADAWHIIDP